MKSIALLLLVLLPASFAAAAADAPLKVVMFSGSSEYNSRESLEALKKMLFTVRDTISEPI